MEWFIRNKEWLLSGAAIAIPIAIITWLFSKKSRIQKQKGGKGSTNIQVGRDININRSNEEKNE